MNNWLYKDKEVIEVPEETFGFVYRITCLQTGMMYIGRKQVLSTRNVPLTKSDIQLYKDQNKRGRVPKKKKVIKESKWRTYWGSNVDFLLYVKELGLDNFRREILQYCTHKKQLTYYETKYLFTEGVLESDKYFNSNIQGKFYPKDV